MLREPWALPVTVTEQPPELSTQDIVENVTLPGPVCMNLTFPDGFRPVTCTVQVDEAPTVTRLGVQLMLVEEVVVVEKP
jgi:hypothetical protein